MATMVTRVSSSLSRARSASLWHSPYPSRFLSSPTSPLPPNPPSSNPNPNPNPSPNPSPRPGPRPNPNYNPRETVNPDPATLREQWLYASRLFGRWSSYAWGSTALAGAFFFALGWAIKGENPLLLRKEAWDAEKTKETPPP